MTGWSACDIWDVWKLFTQALIWLCSYSVEWWPGGFWIVLLLCIMGGDAWQCRVALLMRPVLCQMIHWWINPTRLSELSVSYQKFSFHNGAVQVRGRLPSVRQTEVAADGRRASIGRCYKGCDVMFLGVFSWMCFWRSRGAATHRWSSWQAI